MQVAQPAAQVAPYLGVERAERLVEQQHARLDGQRAGQRHALALAARELRRRALAEAAELDQVEQLVARRRISCAEAGSGAAVRAGRTPRSRPR